MPSTTTENHAIPETVTVPSGAVLDAIAALHALWDYFGYVRGERLELGGAMDSPLGEWCLDRAGALQEVAFGEIGKNDDDWVKSPVEVERYARASESLAEIFKTHVREQAEDVEERLSWTYLTAAREREERAVAIREAGDINA